MDTQIARYWRKDFNRVVVEDDQRILPLNGDDEVDNIKKTTRTAAKKVHDRLGVAIRERAAEGGKEEMICRHYW